MVVTNHARERYLQRLNRKAEYDDDSVNKGIDELYKNAISLGSIKIGLNKYSDYMYNKHYACILGMDKDKLVTLYKVNCNKIFIIDEILKLKFKLQATYSSIKVEQDIDKVISLFQEKNDLRLKLNCMMKKLIFN